MSSTVTRRSVLVACCVCGILAACAPAASSSSTLGGIVGTVVLMGATPAPTGQTSTAFRDVTVTATLTNSMPVQSYVTAPDDGGHWAMSSLPSGSYTILVEKPGYGSIAVAGMVTPGDIAQAPTATLPLAGVAVSGCAELEGTSAGPAAITANLNVSGGSSPPQPFLAKLGVCEDGQAGYPFTFQAVTPGSYTVSVTSGGYSGATPAFTVGDAPVTLAILLVSRQSGSVTGSVSDTVDTGVTTHNLSGLVVTLDGGADLGNTLLETTTDALGSYSFPSVPVSPSGAAYAISVVSSVFVPVGSTTGHNAASVTVMPQATSTVSPIPLHFRTWTVDLCVYVPPPAVDSSGVTVTLSGTMTATGKAFNWPGADGMGTNMTTMSTPCVPGNMGGDQPVGSTFSIPDVPAGTYTITLTRPGFVPVTVPNVVVPGTDATGNAVNVSLPMVTMSRAMIGFQAEACAEEPTDNLLYQAGVMSNPSLIAASVSGGSLLSAVYPAATAAVSSSATPNTCGNKRNNTFTFTNIPAPLGPMDTYTLTLSDSGYGTYTGKLNCVPDPSNSSACSSMVALTGGSNLKVVMLDNSISGCVLMPSNSFVTVQLSGTAFDGTQIAPGAGPTQALSTGSPQCGPGVQGYLFQFSGVPNGNFQIDLLGSGTSQDFPLPPVVIDGSQAESITVSPVLL